MFFNPTALKLNQSIDFELFENIFLKYLKPMRLGKLKLTMADGKHLQFGNGASPYAEIHIKNRRFFKRVVLGGEIGFGESYVDGDWETNSIKDVIRWMIVNKNSNPQMSGSKLKSAVLGLTDGLERIRHEWNKNTITGSRANISSHYDLSNEFYKLFLDPTMTYSSGLFITGSETLYESQINKYKKLTQLANIKKGDHVLEIGCGWGGLTLYLAQNVGCKVTAVTLSKEQHSYVDSLISKNKLEDKIDLQLKDYRHLEGKFDKIISVEMIEAVGHEFLNTYFKQLSNLTQPEGVIVLQAITINDDAYEEYRKSSDWIRKHIFPGGHLPSIDVIQKCLRKNGDLQMYYLEDFAISYAKTLNFWHKQFTDNLDKVKALGFDDKFIRKWYYYFELCEAAFLERNIGLLHIKLSRPNNTHS